MDLENNAGRDLKLGVAGYVAVASLLCSVIHSNPRVFAYLNSDPW